MAEVDIQPQIVLRCPQCNKPFDKQSTLKRHGYYCRSRKEGAASRARSCIACAKRKARCDTKQPTCSGCMTRHIDCHYPATLPKGVGKGGRDKGGVDAPATEPSVTANSLAFDSPHHIDHLPFQDELATPVPIALGNSGDGWFDWNNPAFDFADPTSNWQTKGDIVQFSPPLTPTLVHEPTPSALQNFLRQQTVLSSYMSIPRQPHDILGSLVQRPKMGPKTQRTAALILQTLKSYPLMLLQHDSLPPFIHPRMMTSVGAENDNMEPLNNCISLLHMTRAGVPGNRKLFWRNIRMECERFYQEYHGWNKWQLLAAMQALLIYLISKVDKAQPEYNSLDSLLVAAVVALATRLGTVVDAPDNDLDSTWNTWIFEESRRRLCVMYQVVDMLVYFEPAGMCNVRKQTDLVIAPLPAKKRLWEAGNVLAWKAESEKEEADTRAAFALAGSGDLVRIDQAELQCISDVARLGYKPQDSGAPGLMWRTADWDDWCSGMDGFGGLVMLAASLTE
ncbi:hypothetical protein F5144DRAFT_175443 [Chaetomium tenue]|uniref:Uncharacterized protein n=1 Tax=Chaetomium tenue TaxID=1854479 RepID=A0ACB7PAX5_9PEZI|nr:hypothetical protein F5144DRAFT_175443 [Chaetomium globosum]